MAVLYDCVCRECGFEHEIELSVEGRAPVCPGCGSWDTYRACTTRGAVLFLGGGWSPQGYNKHTYLDKHKDVEVFDKKEDHDRVARGEAEAAALVTQKKLDKASRRAFGPDAGVTQNEADAAVKKAGDDRVE